MKPLGTPFSIYPEANQLIVEHKVDGSDARYLSINYTGDGDLSGKLRSAILP